jgi:hypothetical protein
VVLKTVEGGTIGGGCSGDDGLGFGRVELQLKHWGGEKI